MVNYNLEPSESILIQSTGVLCEGGGLMTAYTDELILTNMNIIHVSKGMFGNTKRVQKYPLNQVKIINGEAQAIMGKSTNGIPNLQIYFKNGQVSFKFQNSGKKEIVKYINEISKVLIGKESSRNSVANQFAIPGAEIVTETLKDTIDVFKGTFGIKSKIKAADEPVKATKKCIGCMSPLSGTKGQSIRCRYCYTDQIL
ncbi:PH domain-containing protein [Schinkia sp. CFF1]